MTLSVFPSLPGLGWPLTRAPIWKTTIQTTQSGREMRAANMSYPLYKWSATYDVLRTAASLNEFQQLMGFYNLMSGSVTPFVYNDPDDNTATVQGFGTGDGTTKQFQVLKNLGGIYVEPVGFVNTSGLTVFDNGSTVSGANYTVNSPYNGWITFTTAPVTGHALTWTGTYGYVCRFLADTYEFSRIYSGIYESKKIEFQSIKP